MADNLKGIPFSSEDEGRDFPSYARALVFYWATEGLGVLKEHPTFSVDEVYVVWFNYTLGNWKALCSTSLPDGRYYEVTHKRDTDGSDGPAVTYIDTYRKTHNIMIDETAR